MKTNKLLMRGVLVAALIILGAVNVMAQVTPPDSDFEVVQNTDGKTLTISGYNGTAKNIIIPKTLRGLPVTVIGDSAFYQKDLTGVVIPNSVTGIAGSAFAYNRLTSVTIPDSTITIERYAFFQNQLQRIQFGAAVQTIGDMAFRNNKLTAVSIPDSVSYIGAGAFVGKLEWDDGAAVWNELISVSLGRSVRIIGANAFSGNKLKELTLPNTVYTVGERAFADNFLVRVNLGVGLCEIKGYAFANNQLQALILPATLGSGGGRIAPGAFIGNTTITEPVILPPGLHLGDVQGVFDDEIFNARNPRLIIEY